MPLRSSTTRCRYSCRKRDNLPLLTVITPWNWSVYRRNQTSFEYHLPKCLVNPPLKLPVAQNFFGIHWFWRYQQAILTTQAQMNATRNSLTCHQHRSCKSTYLRGTTTPKNSHHSILMRSSMLAGLGILRRHNDVRFLQKCAMAWSTAGAFLAHVSQSPVFPARSGVGFACVKAQRTASSRKGTIGSRIFGPFVGRVRVCVIEDQSCEETVDTRAHGVETLMLSAFEKDKEKHSNECGQRKCRN